MTTRARRWVIGMSICVLLMLLLGQHLGRRSADISCPGGGRTVKAACPIQEGEPMLGVTMRLADGRVVHYQAHPRPRNEGHDVQMQILDDGTGAGDRGAAGRAD